MKTILDKLRYWVSIQPEKTLFVFLDIDGEEKEHYTYQTFYDRTTILATNLSTTYDIKPGERVLLAYPPGLELICAFFACVRLGWIPVPVYPPYQNNFETAFHKLNYIIEDCQATAILTTELLAPVFVLKTDGLHVLHKLICISTDSIKEKREVTLLETHQDLLFLQYTSGSTSDPKGVMVSHENIFKNCELTPDDLKVAVSWLPQYHDMGLIGYYLFVMIKGKTTIGFSPLDFIRRPGLWLEAISKYKATASSAPNFAFEYCLREGKIKPETFEKLDLSSLTFLMNAAEPVRSETYLRFLKKYEKYGLQPASFFTAYGLAENTLIVTNYGRRILSLNKHKLKQSIIKVEASDIENKHLTTIVSCGRPSKSTTVKIVDPITYCPLQDEEIGEVWVSGPSKCLGYWQRPTETKITFHAAILDDESNHETYLRTGDLGFIYEGELYVCGRHKDMIIIRGLNYYPQDIEQLVEQSSVNIRKGGVAAFGIEKDGEERLVVLAEVKDENQLMDLDALALTLRNKYQLNPYEIAILSKKAIPKTGSGKTARAKCKAKWVDKKLPIIQCEKFALQKPKGQDFVIPSLQTLSDQYGLSGTESISLVEAGMDSIDLVELMLGIERKIKTKGKIDIRLLQSLTIAQVFQLFKALESGKELDIELVLKQLDENLNNTFFKDKKLMQEDLQFDWSSGLSKSTQNFYTDEVLLTGATGFLGPFLLANLIHQTEAKIHVLIRAPHPMLGLDRIENALEASGILTTEIQEKLSTRVIPICGDLSQKNLGLTDKKWDALSRKVHTIYHNGAQVNYLLAYEELRGANVLGTKELLRLASQGKPKVFNHISTTFIFGWSVKKFLWESESNHEMENLDFGYSQSKWVSEQLIHQAAKKGLQTRIFRPSVISPAINGAGTNLDIAIRLLAFMINHGLGINSNNQISLTPVDIAAQNIIAISSLANSIGKTFHVTNDTYYSMSDITNMICRFTGLSLNPLEIPKFVSSLARRCTPADILFPLKNFFIRSADEIIAMERKRYDNQNYKLARSQSPWGIPDPSLEEIISSMLNFMNNQKIIDLKTTMIF